MNYTTARLLRFVFVAVLVGGVAIVLGNIAGMLYEFGEKLGQ